MQHFSNIYEKLIDMGFANDAIDASIKKGLYTFDMIFNDLVETDPDLKTFSESNNFNKYGNTCHPILKLRANPYVGIFEEGIENKFMDMAICDSTDSFSQMTQSANVGGDWRCRMPSELQWTSTSQHDQWLGPNPGSINSMLPMECGGNKQRSIRNGSALDGGMGITEAISSTVSSSSMLSVSSSNEQHPVAAVLVGAGEPNQAPIRAPNQAPNQTARIQIMDLLDPSFEPATFSHPFLAAICTIRDLICWFHRCRYSSNRMSKPHPANESGRSVGQLAIPYDTSLSEIIELFQRLRWHFVMPSGAQSNRIVGEHCLDRSIGSLGLHPNAHLLAIVSCPSLELGQRLEPSTAPFSMATVGGNHSNATEPTDASCSVDIEIIDSSSSSSSSSSSNIHYRLLCDPDKTTLDNIATEFSRISRIDVGTFTLLRQEPRQMFSYPEDYLRTLTELELIASCDEGRVCLSCYRLDQHWPNPDAASAVGSGNHANNSSGESFQAPFASPLSDSSAIMEFESITRTPDLVTYRNPTQPFSGIGIPLPGCQDNRSVAELWADRSFDICALSNPSTARLDRRPKSLLHLCFKEIYRLLRIHNNSTCRSMKKLPNNTQQIFIKFLLDDKLLTPSLLSYFCAAGSNLTCLDLSYSLLATNELLKCISKCSSLEELILDNEDHTFSNEGLWHLRYLTRLRRLSLNYCAKINDWGIQVVGALPSLSVLAIKYTSVTNVGLKHIYLHLSSQNDPVSSVPALRSVDLSGLTVSDECMTCIGMFTQLELLNLSSSHITNPSSFPRLPELRHLDISHCHKLAWETQVHVKSLCDSFPKLSSINVRGVSNVNLVHITMAISNCKFIRQLDGILCHPQMTASLVASLSHLPLETIILTNCRHVSDLWLPVLARFSATLTHLVLNSCSGLIGDNNSILNNLSRLRNLSWLDLTHLDNVASFQICQLLLGNHFPRLQVAWISLTEQQESEFRSQSQHLNFKINVTRSLIKQLNAGGQNG